MSPTRREALAQMAALAALPLTRWDFHLADDPLDGTIAAFQAGRRKGHLTSLEVTKLALERCRADGSAWHTVDVLTEKSAIAEARASDARLRAKRLHGPLDGVPLFAKAIYDVAGFPTTGSNAEWARLFPDAVPRDSIEVARMRAAGAVILGKTAADDFAYHGSGASSYTGQVVNPHDASRTHIPGGSSAGTAVAVADGMAYAGLGTDDGGSNRIPAQFSGVVGMKPTFGLVPRTGVIPTWPYLDTHGPLARTVADAALLLAAIAGPDASDPLALATSIFKAPVLRDDALAGVRLGLVEGHAPRTLMTAEAIATWDRALDDLRAAGAVLESFAPPVHRMNYRALFEAASTARGDVKPDPYAPAPTANALFLYFARRTSDPRAAIRLGYAAYQKFYDVLPATYEACEPLFEQPMVNDPAGRSFALSRASVVASLADAMRAANVEVMVYPTMPYNAPLIGAKWPDVRTPLGFGNWLGLPEVSVPAGMGADGLPALNLSVVGLPGTDARVLQLAHAYEQHSKRFVRPPRP